MEAAGSDFPSERGRRIVQAGERRLATLESLRGVAAVAVMTGHIMLTTGVFLHADTLHRMVLGGGFGVFLFFALSGYLLFWPFARRHFGGGEEIDLRRYATNRVLRIAPLYYVVVVVVLLLQADHGTATEWLSFATFSAVYFGETSLHVPVPVWSLMVEVLFYLALPLLALGLGWAARGSRGRAALILLALGGASLALRFVTVLDAPAPSVAWRYSPLNTFVYFVPGMLLALLRLHWEERPPRWLPRALQSSDVWVLAAGAVWVYLLWSFDEWMALPAAFLLVGACVLPLRPGRLTRALAWRPLAVLGIASYSLYMWHLAVLHAFASGPGLPGGFVISFALLAPLCVAVALASYWLIEAPFLRLRRRWAPSSAPIEPAAPQRPVAAS
jgi:peptidoglycan/LPS O-acetylase OafA/YrhL